MSRSRNRNAVLLEDVSQLYREVFWNEYEYKDHFSYLCTILPELNNERIVATNEVESLMRKPCVYVLVINGRIFKIGKAEGTMNVGGFAGRISSYNCGRKRYREGGGTNSTTNYWVLQSLLNMNNEVEVYGYFPDNKTAEIFGETISQAFPSPKTIEGVVIKQFEAKYHKKPIGNTQG